MFENLEIENLDCLFGSPFLSSPHSALVNLSNKIMRRRAKSATCNRHSKNQNGYPV
jgi:hypothetical protein